MPLLTIPKNYANGETLFEADLDDFKNSTEQLLNTTQLDSANIQLGGIDASTKIIDATITNDLIADDAVSTGALASTTVTVLKFATDAMDTIQFQDASVTRAKRGPINVIYGSNFTLGPSAPTGQTAGSVTIVTTGHPVIIMGAPNTDPDSLFELTSTSASASRISVRCTLKNGATIIGEYPLCMEVFNSPSGTVVPILQIPISSIVGVHFPAAGSQTYTLTVSLGPGETNTENWKIALKGRLVAYEVV